MKNNQKILFLLALLLISLGITSCGGKNKHTHNFVIENPISDYLKEDATCTHASLYYYSCSCGEHNDKTFEFGDRKNHHYIEKVDEKFLAKEGNCQEKTTYYRSCEYCGDTDEYTFETEYGSHLLINREWDSYLKEDATCQKKAVYYKSCEYCDYASDETFEGGELGYHYYIDLVEDKYLKAPATCTDQAQYYYSCEYCGIIEDDGSWFYSGELEEHVLVEKVEDEYIKESATCSHATIYCKTCENCGFKSDETFEYGEKTRHQREREVIDEKYLMKAATCTSLDEYYLSCGDCHEIIEGKTFVNGVTLDHNFVDDVCTICDNHRGSEGLVYEPNYYYKGMYYKLASFGTCSAKDVYIASTYENHPVKDIDQDCGDTVPDNVESVTFPSTLDDTGQYFLTGKTSITKVVLKEGIQKIGSSSFFGTSLTTIEMPNTITEIRESAFSGCKSLTNIIFSNNLQKIDGSVFYGCTSLKNVTVPEGVTSLGTYVFAYCTALERVILPQSLSVSPAALFEGCKSLKYIELGGLTQISNSMFNATNLIDVSIPKEITEIGQAAYGNCKQLKSITISKTLKSIGVLAFADCGSAEQGSITIYFDGTKEEWLKIEKGENWRYNSFVSKIQYSDGTVESIPD